ncbi:UDP-N-acetylglucosamine 4,6-dehydratase (inverting) [Roseiterribacter gracilis]|uniref:UDP-N-acetylglucosamine 4,6-dehydratase (Inverting) n=1 Tax=Roseiterribacter gracilis TaxID=2812848 RepID=A0A8S8XK23_9PROT|nr:UDP-N-acetylglucosamine 4,6-dehydratase (inverting) [Rhodospirillales bacterium TMPK1]
MYNLDDTSILVTGGTGSFGKAFVAHVLQRWKPRRLVVFSRDELKQYEMEQMFPTSRYPCMRYFIGDVRDLGRLTMAMRDIQYVVHAAALKHVPIAEYNPFECVMTNIGGAQHVVQAALANGVTRVVALSTDKAASPINLYGASKLASDKIFVASNNLVGSLPTRFSVVRYGNVLGSRGSVVPFFRKLIDQKVDSLPITDPRMTRFWITLPQGVEFVLSCLEQTQGGEIFVPRLASMRVTDLARTLAPDLPQHVVGIRPGEKLHEALITEDDARTTVELPDRFVIEPGWRDGPKTPNAKQVAEDFSYTSDNNDNWLDEAQLRQMLKEADAPLISAAA